MNNGRCANVLEHVRAWLWTLALVTLSACRADPQPAFAATTEAPAPDPRAGSPGVDRRSELAGPESSPTEIPAAPAAPAHGSSTDDLRERAPESIDSASVAAAQVGPGPARPEADVTPTSQTSSIPELGQPTDDATVAGKAEPTAPTEPLKVLILGDSLAATGFGAVLEQQLDAHPHVHAYRKAKSASGLARPDFFDWMAEGKRQVEARQPDLVVVIMGGNDGQDLTGNGQGDRVRWDTPAWKDAYAERVRAFVDEIHASGRALLWLGLPRTGTVKFERKLEIIREVQKTVVEARGPTATYLDTSPFLLDDDGVLLREAPVGSRGRPQRLREDDGIHFTMGGSRFFAAKVYPTVLQALGLPVEPEAD